MPKRSLKKKPAKAKPAPKAPTKEPNPLDDVVELLEKYEKGTPPVKPQAYGDCPEDDEH